MIFPTFSGKIPYNNKNTELFEFFRLFFGFLVIEELDSGQLLELNPKRKKY